MSWGFGVARILVFAFGLTMALAGLFLIAVEGLASRSRTSGWS